MLIDAHCHLDDERLLPNVEKIVKAFTDDGIAAVVSASSDVDSSRINVELANKYPNVFATVGIHPQEAVKKKPIRLTIIYKCGCGQKGCGDRRNRPRLLLRILAP